VLSGLVSGLLAWRQLLSWPLLHACAERQLSGVSSFEDTSPFRLGLCPYDLIDFDYLPEDPNTKYSHIWVRALTREFGGEIHNSVHNDELDIFSQLVIFLLFLFVVNFALSNFCVP